MTAEDVPAVRSALLRYRIMAWVVGILLVVLVCVGVPLKYLAHNDTVEIGKYKIKYLVDESGEYEKTMIMRPGGAVPPFAPTQNPAQSAQPAYGGHAAMSSTPASIKVLNGAAAGREVTLTKVVTTVGKPGVQVASITKRPNGYAFAHVEGSSRPSINGVPLVGDSVPLRNGDVIELAGTQMQFIHH